MSAQLSPYKGLMPFDDSERDALLFFGREREREIAAANLIARRLTVLYGPSGVGKSSLLGAGVVYELREQARGNLAARGRPELAVVAFRSWRDDPVAGLRAALGDPEGGTLADAIAAAADRAGGAVYIVLDQFEEYFLYHDGEDGPGTFAVEFPDAVGRPGLPVHFLIGIREDALARLDAFKGRIPNLFGNSLRLDRLDVQAARTAILGPIEQLNRVSGNGSYGVEPELVSEVVAQVAAGRIDPGLAGIGVAQRASEPGRVEAPYLQLVLQRIWEVETEAGSRVLHRATLDGLGGAERIVREHLERALDGLTDAQKEIAARMFGHLVTPSGTKIAHDVRDLARYVAVDETEVQPVVAALEADRILRPVAGEGRRYEIFHDVLAAAVLAWTARYESERAVVDERRAGRRRLRRVVLGMGILLALLAAVTAVAVYALAQRSQARTEARNARIEAGHSRARALEATALAQLSTAPKQSLKLAVAAARLYPTPQAEDVLRQALLASHERAVLHTRKPVSAAVFSPDGAQVLVASTDGTARILDPATFRVVHTLPRRGPVTSAAYAPDGKTFVTTSDDGAARLWDASTGKLLHTFRRDGQPVLSATFGPGNLLVTAGADRTARLWNRRTGRLLRTLPHPGTVYSAVANRDGTIVATVAEDPAGHRRARLFDVPTGAQIWTVPEKGVTSVLFSPDGKLFVTTSTDHKARIRNLSTHQFLHALTHEGHVVGASFSPDGKRLVTASADGTASVWDTASGQRQLLLVGPTGGVNSAQFSPDGRFVVISSVDGTARVYQSDDGRERADLIGHAGAVTGASYSPDGRAVVTAGVDGTARLWDPGVEDQLQKLPGVIPSKTAVRASFDAGGRSILVTGSGGSELWRPDGRPVSLPRGSGPPFTNSATSPDGRLAATRDARGGIHIWNLATGTEVRVLHGAARPGGVAFSPDGTALLAWSLDGTARLWDLGTGRLVHVLPLISPVTSAAFSPDGRLVATAGSHGAAKLWDAATGAPLHDLTGHRGWIARIAFSPDSKTVVTAGTDSTARLWSASSGALLHVLKGHTKGLTDAEFSPDGRRVVTASHDGTVRIWDARTGRPLHVLGGSFSGVSNASFSPDGRWVVGAARNVALLWRADTGQLFTYLRGHADRNAAGHAAWLTGASFGPDGARVLTASEDGTARLYDCDVCGPLPALVALARSRLAR